MPAATLKTWVSITEIPGFEASAGKSLTLQHHSALISLCVMAKPMVQDMAKDEVSSTAGVIAYSHEQGLLQQAASAQVILQPMRCDMLTFSRTQTTSTGCYKKPRTIVSVTLILFRVA